MSILSYNIFTPGLIGVSPRIVYIRSTDNYSTITTPGYMNRNGNVLQGLTLNISDVVFMDYSVVPGATTVAFAILSVSISNGITTLSTGGTINIVRSNGTEVSNLVTTSGTVGTLTTIPLITPAGSFHLILWTDSNINPNSVIQLSSMGGTNTNMNYTINVVPGTGSATLTIFNNSASTALNGTLVIGYQII